MEHIVQFAIGIDDARIQSLCEEAASKQIAQSILEFANGREKWGNKLNTTPENLTEIFREEIKRVVDENKDYIIENAIKEVSNNMMKTRAVKDAIQEVVKEN